MGNLQASPSKSALAQFYANNGADVNQALSLIRKSANAEIVNELCKLMGKESSALMPPPQGVSGGAEGGAESFIGGLDDMQNYGNSMYSKAKEKLIRAIAKDVFSALKMPTKNADTAPIEDVVAHLTKVIPPNIRNPRKFHPNFGKSASTQKHVIKVLADAINRHYSGALIDVNDDENAMAYKVGEIIYSLLQGLQTEFMNIAGDAMRVMNNMQIVQNYLDAAYKKQQELIANSGDPRIRDQSASTDEVYKAVKSEYERQSAILANLLNVSIGPTGKSLISSLEDSRDFTGLVKDLRTMVGTQAFGDKLSYLLSGISTAAHSAELIDKALKKIGMSVAEFKAAPTAGDLRAKVFRHIMNQSPSSKKLDEMMRAARIIYEANYDHNAVSKLLGKKGGAEGDDREDDGENPDVVDTDPVPNDFGDDASDSGGEAKLGGDDELPTYWKRKSLSKKIENKKKYRDLVLKDFKRSLRVHYQSIVNAANQIARRIGNGLPISDDLKLFVDAFAQLPSIDAENLHLALSGYPKDSENKQKREEFMNKFEVVLKVCELLSKGSEGQVFKSLGAAISNMIRELDNFSDKMVKALTEIHIDTPDEIATALRKTSSTFYGSGPDDGGDELFGSGSWVSFEKIKSEMVYFFNIANVKSNLLRSHEDLKSYAEDYEQILGEEAAWLIDRIKRNYLAKIELITEENVVAGGVMQVPAGDKYSAEDIRQARAVHAALVASVTARVGPNQPGNPVLIDQTTKTSAQWALTNLKNIWNFQMNAKVNMVKVAQAVDMYLKAFTDGIAKNPDSISSVVKMLNEVEIVANWFNNRSGNNLASLFEVFPCVVNNAAGADNSANVLYSDQANSVVVDDENAIKLLIPDDTHYYVYLENRWSAGAGAGAVAGRPAQPNTDHYNLPGNPFLGRPLFGNHTTPKQCKGIIMLSQKVVKSMRALENILSAFASVGAKLGDVDPLARTFMNPGQMFNSLCDYVAASAFSTEFTPPPVDGHPNANTSSLLYHGKITEEKVVHSDGRQEQKIPTNLRADRYRGDNAPWSHTAAHLRNEGLNGGVLPGDVAHAPGEFGIRTGVSEANVPAQNWRKYGSVALAAIPAETTGGFNQWKYHDAYKEEVRYDLAGWRDNFFDTDNLFQMTIKSIVAKIFTVVDAYRLFNRPVVDRRAQYSLNPLRTILGGADGGADGGAILAKVKVVPEALELYYRLILLAEWYRENFGVSTRGLPNFNNWRVAIVPSIDGVWSEFVEVIFDKAEHVKEGNYTETQVQKLIVAMNEIWKLYKSKYPKATTRGILNAFVLEMNRAFGFLKQQEIQAYIDQRRDMYKQSAADGDNAQFLDYDILNANDQFGARPAPSDKFARVSANESKRKERNMVFLQEAVEELRKRIDVEFLKETQNLQDDVPDSTSHFQETLKNYRSDMANAKTENDEYRVVLRMLQGANRKIQLSVDKLIMVHEAVAAPLAVLYAVYKVLARFNSLMHGCSLVNLAGFNVARVGAAVPEVSAVMNDAYESFAAYRQYIQNTYRDILDKNKPLYTAMFARAFTGVTNFVAGGVINGHGFKTAPVPINTAINADQIDGAELLENIFAALLDFGSNPNKLVTVAVGGNGNINIDFATLEEICKDLLNQVKENINKLRLSFNPADVPTVLGKFEDLANVGSARWLEEHLVQILFNDRDKCGLPRAVSDHMHQTVAGLCVAGGINANANPIGNPDARYGSMDKVMRSMLYYSLKRTDVTVNNAHYYVKATEFPGNVLPLKREPVTQEEKKTVSLMDANDWGPAPGDRLTIANQLMPIPLILFTANPNKYNFETPDHTSLINTLNNVLHMYLYTNVDSGSNKFYLPLIESFATSVASLEIVQGKAFPNIHKYHAAVPDKTSAQHHPFGAAVPPRNYLLSPQDSTVIYASNALICKSLLTTQQSIGTVQKKKFAYESLADIPAHVRERMCVNLPFFSKIFNLITERATLLKNMFTNMASLRANVISSVPAGGVEDNLRDAGDLPTGCSPLKATVGDNSDQMAKYFDGLLTHLIECAGSLRKCADNVYKELQDKPSPFFETGKDFLQDYRSKNGGIPLMPISSVLAPLRCLEGNPNNPNNEWNSTSNAYLALPVAENGSAVYKYNFATRLVLAKQDLDVSLDHFPGAKEVYNAYSAGAPRNSMIAPSDYVKTITHMFKLAKFLMDGANYGRFFACGPRELNINPVLYNSRSVFQAVNWRDAEGMDNDSADALSQFAAFVAAPGTQATIALMAATRNPPPHANGNYARPYTQDMQARNNKSLRIYPLANQINAVVELTEGTNMTTNKDNLSLSMGIQVGGVSGDMRKRMRVLNILDAGIVPLNVHAFMREVPFVNLLNYSYTFDRMVHDFVMPSYIKNQVTLHGDGLTSDHLMIKANSDINSTRELLVKLLVHPYADLGVDGKQYFALTASLFNGNDNLKLGRPRYLSDQLWHKVLMTSSAQIVAGQQEFNSMDAAGNNRYPANLPALESGPSAYEAVRAITRYSSQQLNKVQSIHTSGLSRSDTTTRTAVLVAFVDAVLAAAGVAAPNPRNNIRMGIGNNLGPGPIALGALNANELLAARLFTTNDLLDSFRKARDLVRMSFNQLDSRNVANAFLQGLPGAAAVQQFAAMFSGGIGNPSQTIRYVNILEAQRMAAAVNAAAISAALAPFPAGGFKNNLLDQYNNPIGLGGSSDVDAANIAGTPYGISINRYGINPGSIGNNDFCMVASATYTAYIRTNVSNPIAVLLATVIGQIVLHPLASAVMSAGHGLVSADIAHINAQFIASPDAAIGHDLDALVADAILFNVDDIVERINNIAANSVYGIGPKSLAPVLRANLEQYIDVGAPRLNTIFAISSNPVAASGLKYWNGRTWTVANNAGAAHNNMATGDVLYCAELGKMRFDTKLVRNLVWFVQTQRIMRVMLTSTLSWINTPVIRGLKIADSKVTEFNGNDQYTQDDFNGRNYDLL